jgi:hypothetical protein
VWHACLCMSYFVLGIYPPQVKVYELKELSMKFERHMISEIVDFQVYFYGSSFTGTCVLRNC